MNNAREFTARLADLLARERTAMADFLSALADFDRRQLWIELGYASLFDYLHRELGLSKGAAHYRKVAAGLVRKHPEVLDAMRDGRLCITGVVHLAKVLTPENRHEVLPRFFHRSKREVAEIAAELQPVEAPPRRAVVTILRRDATLTHSAAAGDDTASRRVQPVEPPGANSAISTAGHLGRPPGEVRSFAPPVMEYPPPSMAHAPVALSDAPSAPRDTRPIVEPLTADLRRLHVTVSTRFLDKLAAARAALSHSRPCASTEDLLETGLDLVLAAHAKRKALVAKPRHDGARPKAGGSKGSRAGRDAGNPPSVPAAKNAGASAGDEPSPDPALSGLAGPAQPSPSQPGDTAGDAHAEAPGSDYVPAHVRRAVWIRDGGRCQYPLESGGVCGSTFQVEFDHLQPRARAGASTVENGRLACRVHNQFRARLAFGDYWMDRFLRRGGEPDAAAP